MSEHGDTRSGGVPSVDRTADGPTVEVYESEGRTVLYEARNPLAWIESTDAVGIEEAD